MRERPGQARKRELKETVGPEGEGGAGRGKEDRNVSIAPLCRGARRLEDGVS